MSIAMKFASRSIVSAWKPKLTWAGTPGKSVYVDNPNRVPNRYWALVGIGTEKPGKVVVNVEIHVLANPGKSLIKTTFTGNTAQGAFEDAMSYAEDTLIMDWAKLNKAFHAVGFKG